MICLRRLLPEIDFASGQIPYEALKTLEVQMADFEAALCEVEPSAIREVFVEMPNVSWDDVGGLDEVKQQLIEAVEWPLKHPEIFAQAGVARRRGSSSPASRLRQGCSPRRWPARQVNFISARAPTAAALSTPAPRFWISPPRTRSRPEPTPWPRLTRSAPAQLAGADTIVEQDVPPPQPWSTTPAPSSNN